MSLLESFVDRAIPFFDFDLFLDLDDVLSVEPDLDLFLFRNADLLALISILHLVEVRLLLLLKVSLDPRIP